MPAQTFLLAVAALACSLAGVAAADITLAPVTVTDRKAVFGRVETRFVMPARARIGGTLDRLAVTEGSAVETGQVIGRVFDPKLALRMRAAEARIAALRAELGNAQSEYERAIALMARGAGTQQRIDQARAQVDGLTSQVAAAEADQAVIAEQTQEGDILAPLSGRILTLPAAPGTVVLPGDAVVTVGGGGYFLRLAVPERHARALREGAPVEIGARSGGAPARQGRLAKLYPRIENGRVIADVEVEGLGDFFVGERTLVTVPIGERRVLAVPAGAIATRSGLDFVRVRAPAGVREVAVIPGGPVETPDGERIEILSGLRPGDTVVVP